MYARLVVVVRFVAVGALRAVPVGLWRRLSSVSSKTLPLPGRGCPWQLWKLTDFGYGVPDVVGVRK